jgi:DNA excision repair protein ERCC-1
MQDFFCYGAMAEGALDFSFLSQGTEAVGVPASAAGGEAACLASARQPPLSVGRGLVVSRKTDGLEDVPESWTLWDSSRQGQRQGGVAGGVLPYHGSAHQPAGAAVPTAGGTSFTRAFAHMKERPGYEPPPARAQQQPAAQGRGQSSHSVGGTASAPSVRTIQVSRRQTNNPVLRCIRNVPWEYAEIVADYQLGSQTCCLFLRFRALGLGYKV